MDTNTEEKREAASRQLVGAVVALVILQGIVLGGAFVMLGTLSESLANTLIIPVLLVGGVPIVFLMRRLSALETAFWKEVAQLHGGEFHLERREGGGLSATLILPRNS